MAAANRDVLSGMSLDDKKRLYDRIGLDLSSDKEPWSRLEQDTWDSICEVVPSARPGSMKASVSSYGRKRYAEKCEEIDQFISEACAPAMRLVVRQRVRVRVLRCLVDWMREQDIILAVPALLNCLEYLPGAVALSFPGYSEARLLHRVAAQAV